MYNDYPYGFISSFFLINLSLFVSKYSFIFIFAHSILETPSPLLTHCLDNTSIAAEYSLRTCVFSSACFQINFPFLSFWNFALSVLFPGFRSGERDFRVKKLKITAKRSNRKILELHFTSYRGANIAKSFSTRKFGDFRKFGDIGTFGDIETRIKHFVQKWKKG